jgi:hypothetical protein
MNKVVLFFIGLGMVTVALNSNCGYKIQPLTAAELAKSFNEAESRHKSAWLNLAAENHAKKFKLLDEQHKEWAQLHEEKIDAISKIGSADEAEKTLFDFFKRAYDIVVKQREAWKKACSDQYQKGLDLYNQFKAEHESFRVYTQENDFKALK